MVATEEEARELANTLHLLLGWANVAARGEGNEVVALVRDHLGEQGLTSSVVDAALDPFDQVNLQVALDAWSQQPGRTVVVRGIASPPNFGGIGLQQLVHGDGLPPVRLSAPDLADLPAGPDRTISCLRLGLLLVTDTRGAYVVLVRGPAPRLGDASSRVEVAGLPTADAQQVLRELAELRHQLNVFRGQVLELEPGPQGPVLRFPRLPVTSRADVVLPEPVLARIERQVIGVARHRRQLLAAGQHLKRGLLLYGPPGTGKTHTTRYLLSQLPGTTVILLSGRSLGLIGAATTLARDLAPAAVVLEDVDLVAEHRGHGTGPNPILFELLDAMDGAAADADLLFLLTTNRADLLEPALAARPGRVDVAVEIGLPAADARRRLLTLYGGVLTAALDTEVVETVVSRTEGVTASFIKELVRRAVLVSLGPVDDAGQPDPPGHDNSPPPPLKAVDLLTALDDLLDDNQSVTRALLGVPTS